MIMKKMIQYTSRLLTILLLVSMLPFSNNVYATDDSTRYYLGSAVNTGLDTGYSESNIITEDDPHFGWTLSYCLTSKQPGGKIFSMICVERKE